MLKGADFIAVRCLSQRRPVEARDPETGKPRVDPKTGGPVIVHVLTPVADPEGRRAPRTCERVAEGYPSASAASDALQRLKNRGAIRLAEKGELSPAPTPRKRRRMDGEDGADSPPDTAEGKE